MTSHQCHILLIDDDEDSDILVRGILEDAGHDNYRVDWRPDFESGLHELLTKSHDVCLLDYQLGEKTGLDLLSELANEGREVYIPIIMLTGKDEDGIDIAAMRAGAADYLSKDNLTGVAIERSIKYSIERKVAERELMRQAQYDSVTGLANRALFKDYLEAAIARCTRHGHEMALLFMDLDFFKSFNDALGHYAGDLLLTSFGKRLTACTRAEDLVARVGGDEFAVVLDSVRSGSDARRVADNILAMSRPPHLIGEHEISVQLSIGIATWPHDANSADALVKAADSAMYSAKKRGRNRFEFYSDEMQTASVNHAKLEQDLARAAEQEEFILYYQPQIEVADRQPIALEALLRWRHGGGGILGPEEFIPIAETSGQMMSIGRWALRHACREVRALRKFPGLSRVKVAVNVSMHQLISKDFSSDVLAILHEAEFEPGALEIELTESALIANLTKARDELECLGDAGISIAVDDFGTGFSSMRYLTDLPIHMLKIDKSFVSESEHSKKHAGIVKGIVSLGHDLGLVVVAEGVENQRQLDFLSELGCDRVQGFFVGAPLPINEMVVLHERPSGEEAADDDGRYGARCVPIWPDRARSEPGDPK